MNLKRIIAMFAVAAGLSLGLPMSAAYAASAAPAAHLTADVHAPGQAVTVSTVQNDNLIPSISFDECTAVNTHPTWVHLDVLTGNGIADWCFGGNGTQNLAGLVVTHMCTGNNSGLYYYKQNGVTHHFSYGPGQVHAFASGVTAVSLIISGHSGADTCVS